MTTFREHQLEQAIGGLPRVTLGVLPTPLEPLPRLSQTLGGPPIFIKRDDLTGLGFGGNKTRMLELSLAHALEQGADTIVTGAAVQSNYCRQMAAACAKLGLELHLVLRPEREIDKQEIQGNHLLQRLFGAHVTLLDSRDRPQQQAALAAKTAELQAAGKRVYWPRRPETIDLDAIAYAQTALEIVRQCRDLGIAPTSLYVAANDTTQAGLVLGFAFLESPIHVHGFNPLPHDAETLPNLVRMANQAAQRLDLDIELTTAHFDNTDAFVGERYGIPTPAGIDALQLMARTEVILLDPVYTSKALSALVAHIRHGQLSPDVPVLFLHTGGAPALFGYAQEVLT